MCVCVGYQGWCDTASDSSCWCTFMSKLKHLLLTINLAAEHSLEFHAKHDTGYRLKIFFKYIIYSKTNTNYKRALHGHLADVCHCHII